MKIVHESPQINIIEMKGSDIICTGRKGTFYVPTCLETDSDNEWETDRTMSGL